jgi:hypothetical protein
MQLRWQGYGERIVFASWGRFPKRDHFIPVRPACPPRGKLLDFQDNGQTKKVAGLGIRPESFFQAGSAEPCSMPKGCHYHDYFPNQRMVRELPRWEAMPSRARYARPAMDLASGLKRLALAQQQDGNDVASAKTKEAMLARQA